MAYKKITEVDNTNQINEEDSLLIIQQNSIKQVPKTNIKFGSSSEPIVYFYDTAGVVQGHQIYRGIKEGNTYVKSEETLTIEDVQNDFLNSSVFIARPNDNTSWDPTIQNNTNLQDLQKVVGTTYYSNTTESTNWNLHIAYGNSGQEIILYNK